MPSFHNRAGWYCRLRTLSSSREISDVCKLLPLRRSKGTIDKHKEEKVHANGYYYEHEWCGKEFDVWFLLEIKPRTFKSLQAFLKAHFCFPAISLYTKSQQREHSEINTVFPLLTVFYLSAEVLSNLRLPYFFEKSYQNIWYSNICLYICHRKRVKMHVTELFVNSLLCMVLNRMVCLHFARRPFSKLNQ